VYKRQLLCIALYRLSQLKLYVAYRSVKPLWLLIAMTICIHGIWGDSAPFFKIPLLNLNFSLGGLLQGLFYAIRIVILVLLASLLTLTTAPMSISDGLYKLMRPFEKLGMPAQDLAMMISIALRFIPILMEEAQRIHRAQLSRGVKYSGSVFKKLQSLLPILIPLFLSTFRRANELAVAMETRCYQSGHPRTSLYTLKLSREDYLTVLIVVPLGLSPLLLKVW
jgi:energy-coupling factor transport system permease protein